MKSSPGMSSGPTSHVPVANGRTTPITATRERVLAVVHYHSHRHVEQLIESLGHFLVPLFFVITGMSVSLEALFDLPVLMVALGVTAVAVAGKIVAGLVAGNVRKAVVGWGMVPRGEVGLIFATIGRQLGVLPDEEFTIIVIMVIITTLMTPPILSYLLRSEGSEGRIAKTQRREDAQRKPG